MMVDFDPKKHKDFPLYELQTREDDGLLATILVLADVPYEEAAQTPWYYVVDNNGNTIWK